VATTSLVERPLRFSSTVRSLPRRGLAVGATAIMLPLMGGLVLGSWAYPGAGSPTITGPAPRGATDGPALLAAGERAPGTLFPSPAAARNNYPPGCDVVAVTGTTSGRCRYADTASRDRIVLLGDSHASQWMSAVISIARRRHWAVEELVKDGCPLARFSVFEPRLGRLFTECDQWRDNTLSRLAREARPQLVIISSLNEYTGSGKSAAAAWEYTLHRITALGAPVVYLRDTPVPHLQIPVCLSGAPHDRGGACSFPRKKALRRNVLADEITGKKRTDVSMISVNDILCPDTTRAVRCPAVLQGVVLYRDGSHLTDTAVRVLTPRVEQLLVNQGLIPQVAGRQAG
jgi:SGNH domain (fused to AT3 domains)